MLHSWTFLIAAHAVAATLSMLLGIFQIVRPTKGDPIHRAIGWAWSVCMVFVAAGSFLFGGFNQPLDIFLRALAVWTLFSVTVGIISARRGNIKRHRGFMVGTYIGLIGAFIGVVVVKTRLVPSWFIVHPLMMSLIAAGIVVVAAAFVGTIVATMRPRGRVATGSA